MKQEFFANTQKHTEDIMNDTADGYKKIRDCDRACGFWACKFCKGGVDAGGKHNCLGYVSPMICSSCYYCEGPHDGLYICKHESGKQ